MVQFLQKSYRPVSLKRSDHLSELYNDKSLPFILTRLMDLCKHGMVRQSSGPMSIVEAPTLHEGFEGLFPPFL